MRGELHKTQWGMSCWSCSGSVMCWHFRQNQKPVDASSTRLRLNDRRLVFTGDDYLALLRENSEGVLVVKPVLHLCANDDP